MYVFHILYCCISIVVAIHNIRVLFINEEGNTAAENAVKTVEDYVKQDSNFDIHLDVQKITSYKNQSTTFINSLCATYSESISSSSAPHFVFDTTRIGYISETVKYFTLTLEIPIISTSYGEFGDIKEWRNINKEQEKYLLQFRPPADMLADIMRPMVMQQKVPNAAIFYDDMFVLKHKFKTLLLNFATRHAIIIADPNNIKQQILDVRELDIANFFILGNLTTVRIVLEGACSVNLLTRRCAWHIITLDRANFKFKCPQARVIVARPSLQKAEEERLKLLKDEYHIKTKQELSTVFYFDLLMHGIFAVKNMQLKNTWPQNMSYITCEEYTGTNSPYRSELDLKNHFENDVPFPPIFGTFKLDKNGISTLQFHVEIISIQIVDGLLNDTFELARWETGSENNFTVHNATLMKTYINDKFFRVVTVEQKPFIYVDKSSPRGFRGFCIDLMDEIARICNFNYDIRLASDATWGTMDESGSWSGVMRELLERRAELGLGAMSVMAEREAVVDFSVPFYEMVGIGIIMKSDKETGSLFKFLTVLEVEVWLCILAAYLVTSLLMYTFDILSPFSYQNLPPEVLTDSTRIFTFWECLWFSITSLTPQGGGEAPRALSGRLVAATWWLFGFIVIASYTANLAAFLTVSRLDTGVDSLEDLAKQYKIAYAPVNGSQTMMYFKRMADIERKFYEIWKDMSLSQSAHHLSVWEYPLSDKYSKLWTAMQRMGLPANESEALDRVRASQPQLGEGFAYIGDASDLRYLRLVNCDLRLAADEFSKKPYAIAIQKGNPLKEQIDNAILQMVNRRYLTHLKDKWWTNNPEAATCDPDEMTGISIQNIAGMFIVLLIGISLPIIILLCGRILKLYFRKTSDRKKVVQTKKLNIKK